MRQRGLLVVLSGPSGSGKSTLAERAMAAHDDIVRSITATTRPPRKGEVNGRDYLFLSEGEFKRRVRDDYFVEYAEFNGNYYGTPREELERLLDDRKVVILVIDVQGAAQIRASELYSVSVFLLPPSPASLRKRLSGRGTESITFIENRLKIAEAEIQHLEEYDYVLINDDPDAATADLLEVIRVARLHRIRGGEREAWQNGDYSDWHSSSSG